MPARRIATPAVALLLAVTGCSDDGEPEPERAEERPATTASPRTRDPGAAALGETETVEGDDLEVVEELAAFVEDVRGRSFLAPPSVRLADDETYEDVLGELLGATLEELLTEAAYLEALGLIPEGSAVQYAEAQRQQLLGSLGFFDEASGILLGRGDDLDDPATRTIVVHELVHAYDHQHFSLQRPEYEGDATTERAETFPIVVEGDTPPDTAELLAALEVWVEATPDGTVEATDEGRVRVEVCYEVPVAPTGNPSR